MAHLFGYKHSEFTRSWTIYRPGRQRLANNLVWEQKSSGLLINRSQHGGAAIAVSGRGFSWEDRTPHHPTPERTNLGGRVTTRPFQLRELPSETRTLPGREEDSPATATPLPLPGWTSAAPGSGLSRGGRRPARARPSRAEAAALRRCSSPSPSTIPAARVGSSGLGGRRSLVKILAPELNLKQNAEPD